MSMKRTNFIALGAIVAGAAIGIGATLALTGDGLGGIRGVEIDCASVDLPRSKAAQRSIRIVYRGTGPDGISQGCRQYEAIRARLEATRERAEEARQRLEATRGSAELSRESAEAARESAEAARESAEALRERLEQVRERLEEARQRLEEGR